MEELREYRLKVQSISAVVYDADPVQTSPSSDRILDAVAMIEKKEREIKKLIGRYDKEKNRIINEIDRLEDPVDRELLFLRYVKYMKLEDIADTMHYSFEWIRERHGTALLRFGRMMDQPTQTYIEM